MKNIFKRNQIIIAALAIMICVAGYLNFAKDKANEPANEEFMQNEMNSSLDALFGDISDEDMMAEREDSMEVSDTGEFLLSEDNNLSEEVAGANELESSLTDATASESAKSEEVATSEDANMEEMANAETANAETANAETANKEVANAKTTSTDTEQEVSNPGEAVLASTTLSSGFFSNAKLTREQNRAKQRENLRDLIADVNVTEEQKDIAIDNLLKMTNIAERENATEIQLGAKGFEDVVVTIMDDSVDVVVNCPSITDQQVAQIEDIVMRKTGAEAADIVISAVVVEE